MASATPPTPAAGSTRVRRRPASPKQAVARRTSLDRRWEAVPLKALADPTRATLLRCLIKCDRPCSVSEVSECCEVDFSVVARHLAALAAAGVLEANKQGRTVWYRARTAALASSLRTLADAMDEWRTDGRSPSGCCKSGRPRDTAMDTNNPNHAQDAPASGFGSVSERCD